MKSREKKSLVMITRAPQQAHHMETLLTEEGLGAFHFPVLHIDPIDSNAEIDLTLKQWPQFDWLLLTSTNGVHFFMNRFKALKLTWPPQLKVACVGHKTANALLVHSKDSDLIPSQFHAEALVEALLNHSLKNKSILFAGGNLSNLNVFEPLKQAGAEFHFEAFYTTKANPHPPVKTALKAVLKGEVDYITFASSSAVKAFKEAFSYEDLAQLLPCIKTASIGPKTSQTLKEVLGRVDIEAPTHTLPALISSIKQHSEKVRHV